MRKIFAIILLNLLVLPIISYSQGCEDAGSDEGAQLFGFIQPQWDNELATDSGNTFKFNRARLGVVGNIPYDFKYYFVIETSPTKNKYPYFLDAFVTYSRFNWARVSVGQFKSPMSLELNTSCSKLHTINRSKVVSELASPDRDLGVMITGGGDTSLVKYAVGFMNGTGKITETNLKDNNKNKDIIARLVINPVQFLSIGGSFKYGISSEDGKDPKDTKSILGGELQLKFNNFLLQSEYLYGKFEGSYTTGGGCGGDLVTHTGSVTKSGFFAQAMYMTPWNFQPIIKFESFDPDLDKDEEGAKASVGSDDEYVFVQDNHGFQNTLTFGLNYWFNDWTRLQINYLYQAEEREFENDMIMIQLQAKF